MALTLDEVRTAPIFIVIVLILINGFVNHLIYKDSVIFLFEKGMTNRQRREWRKEKYFKRKTMRYIRATINSLPEQDFSPNIEKYHVWDIISNVYYYSGTRYNKYSLLFCKGEQLDYCSNLCNF